MGKEIRKFPDGFMWGASTSAFQFEGAFEEDGKGLSIRDTCPIADYSKVSDIKVASDHYHHLEEDIILLAQLGLKAYRFSIAWSRVMPDGREINPKGIEFYDHIIKLLVEYKIEPIVTLVHFDHPQSLEDHGGWLNRAMIDDFVNYSDFLFNRYKDKVRYWTTFNEHNCFLFDSQLFCNTHRGPLSEQDKWQIYHNMMVASSKAFKRCHEKYPGLKIGPVPNVGIAFPATCDPLDIIAAGNLNALQSYILLDAQVFGLYNAIAWKYLERNNCLPKIFPGDMDIMKDGKPDFIAVNHYGGALAKDYTKGDKNVKVFGPMPASPDFYAGQKENPYLDTFINGIRINPIGLRVTLRELDSRYHLPLIITENGLGQPDTLEEHDIINDDYRIEALEAFIAQCHDAIVLDGVRLLGYCPWSAFDLVSLHQGFSKRYGFVYINRTDFDLKDMKRIKKKSFYWYQKLIQTNGLSDKEKR